MVSHTHRQTAKQRRSGGVEDSRWTDDGRLDRYITHSYNRLSVSFGEQKALDTDARWMPLEGVLPIDKSTGRELFFCFLNTRHFRVQKHFHKKHHISALMFKQILVVVLVPLGF